MDRAMLCGPFMHVWACEVTGKSGLTFEEARRSEQINNYPDEGSTSQQGTAYCRLFFIMLISYMGLGIFFQITNEGSSIYQLTPEGGSGPSVSS